MNTASSPFIQEQINQRLAKLRADCAVGRLVKRTAFQKRWARSARTGPENERDSGVNDKYWDERQAKAQTEATHNLENADLALTSFIAEHRHLMPPDWIGNDHGRLCWAAYLGGRPIAQHFCQREEGHDGNHADEWPERRWAYGGDHGSWPQGVTGDNEWMKLRAEASAGQVLPTI